MNTISRQIKKYRTEKGITQEQLGTLVGVSMQAVSKWERGGTPDIELLPVLADVLEVSIDELFGRKQKSLKKTIPKRIYPMDKKAARITTPLSFAGLSFPIWRTSTERSEEAAPTKPMKQTRSYAIFLSLSLMQVLPAFVCRRILKHSF